jgi:hypothetical protein
MQFHSDGGPRACVGSVSDEALDVPEDLEDEDDERPDDALACPLYDTPWHLGDACELCGGREWVSEEAIEDHLGTNRVGCLNCGGEGAVSPLVSWTCPICLGTGRMPVAALAECDHPEYPIYDQDWSGADLDGQSLRGLVFIDCTFANTRFAGANLAETAFHGCQFSGTNPEQAASLDGTRLLVKGLSEDQRAACVARGAILTDNDDGTAR